MPKGCGLVRGVGFRANHHDVARNVCQRRGTALGKVGGIDDQQVKVNVRDPVGYPLIVGDFGRDPASEVALKKVARMARIALASVWR